MGDLDHKEAGLDAGGDDFLTKPFQVRELGARLRSLLRRASGFLSNELKLPGIVLNLDERTVLLGDNKVKLTQRECAVFEHLIRHPNKSFTARALRDSVWPIENEASVEAVRTCMKTFRQKLKAVGQADLIKTEAGAGYTLYVN
jgi:two-component system response regulator QseB/two-component system response regulator TctD